MGRAENRSLVGEFRPGLHVLRVLEAELEKLEEALAEAQELGYAERDPTADVEGYDAGAKAAIIATGCSTGSAWRPASANHSANRSEGSTKGCSLPMEATWSTSPRKYSSQLGLMADNTTALEIRAVARYSEFVCQDSVPPACHAVPALDSAP